MLLSVASIFFLAQIPVLEPGTTKIEFTRQDEVVTPAGLDIPNNLPAGQTVETMVKTGWSLRHQGRQGREVESKFRVKTFQVRVPEDGSWTIRMKGLFDGALILLDENGNWIRADDDGWFWLNPSLLGVDLQVEKTYQLKAIVNGGGIGLAELTLEPFDMHEWETEIIAFLEQEYPLGDYTLETGDFLKTVKASQPPHSLSVETVTAGVLKLLDESQPKPFEQWYRRRLAERDLPTRLDRLKALNDSDDLAVARTLELTARFLALRLTEPESRRVNRLVGFQYAGAFREIRTLYRLALNIKSNRYGSESPKVLTFFRSSTSSPILFLGEIGDRDGIIEFLTLDNKLSEELYGPISPIVIGSLLPLGHMQMESGDFVAARATLTRVLRNSEKGGLLLQTPRQLAKLFLSRLAFAEERELEGFSLIKEEGLLVNKIFTSAEFSDLKQLFNLLHGWESILPWAGTHSPPPSARKLFGLVTLNKSNLRARTFVSSLIVLDFAMQLSKVGRHSEAVESFGEALAMFYVMESSPERTFKKVFEGALLRDPLFMPDEVFLQLAHSAKALGMDELEMRACQWGIHERFEPFLEEVNARPGWRKTDELSWRGLSFPLEKEEVALMTLHNAWRVSSGLESETIQEVLPKWKSSLERFHGKLEKRVESDELHPAHPRLKKVREALAEVCKRSDQPKEAENWQQLAEGKTVSMSPPKLQLWSPSEERPILGERTFLLQGLLEDPSGQPDLQYRLNGGTWVSARDLEVLWEPSEEGKPWRFSVPVSVPRGRTSARFDIQATSSSGEKSEIRVLHPTYQPKERRLFVFAFGVADYEEDALDLAYPTKDVDDIIAAFSAQEGAAFDKVLVKSLKNEEVSSASIRKALKSFLRDAEEDDTIIVFGAGHGVRDEDGEYFFLTPGATFDDPYEGVSRQDIEKLVTWSRLLPARRVLLLDTCQSGRGEADAEGSRGGRSVFMGQSKVDDLALSQAGGLYIIAASSDAGSALESGGNGLFTAGILSALRGEGDANADGKVSIEEVRRFVADFVKEATDGAQNPTFPLVEGGEDFVLAVPR